MACAAAAPLATTPSPDALAVAGALPHHDVGMGGMVFSKSMSPSSFVMPPTPPGGAGAGAGAAAGVGSSSSSSSGGGNGVGGGGGSEGGNQGAPEGMFAVGGGQ